MDDMWLILLIAGLVVGAAFFAGTFIGDTDTTHPGNTQPETETELQSEDGQIEDEGSDIDTAGKIESLDFKVDTTESGEEVTYRFRIKNPEMENEDVRVDHIRSDGSEVNLILRHGRDEGWLKELSSDKWTHFTGFAFTQMVRTRAEDYSAYQVTDWEAMEGHTSTVETDAGTARVYDVRVNEVIPESVFTPE
ncbi:MAG: hypothetical protein ACLFVS_06925 [Candidatus Acetothermia bacterium]